MMGNPFRNKTMRGIYDDAIKQYETRHRNWFHPSGNRNLGNSASGYFWKGYDGVWSEPHRWDAASRKLVTYAYWCAGRDVRAREEAAKVGE